MKCTMAKAKNPKRTCGFIVLSGTIRIKQASIDEQNTYLFKQLINREKKLNHVKELCIQQDSSFIY